MYSAPLRCFAARRRVQAVAEALVKRGNAAAEHLRGARRVGLLAPMAALHRLPRASTLRCALRLALNADRPTESINIILLEY
jgi:hypothetical protein